MRSIDASQGPQPGKHNWFRGATLRTYEAQTLGALEELRGHIDVAPAHELWARALEARWDGTDVWFHGDLAKGNRPLARPPPAGRSRSSCPVNSPAPARSRAGAQPGMDQHP
ncbi:hypothetical protein [Kitasatospora aureofaciens]|uniref:hypothetical protein n=1 Tax=Kitasatospora aureofaciens TaxID=1894 RepID=UPI0033D4D267